MDWYLYLGMGYLFWCNDLSLRSEILNEYLDTPCHIAASVHDIALLCQNINIALSVCDLSHAIV